MIEAENEGRPYPKMLVPEKTKALTSTNHTTFVRTNKVRTVIIGERRPRVRIWSGSAIVRIIGLRSLNPRARSAPAII